VLDEEAAAQFSTAAALAQQQRAKRGAVGSATTPAAGPLLVSTDSGCWLKQRLQQNRV